MRLSIDDHSDPLDLDVVDKHLHPKVPGMEMRGLEMEGVGAGYAPLMNPATLVVQVQVVKFIW